MTDPCSPFNYAEIRLKIAYFYAIGTVVLYRSLCEWDRIRPQYIAEKIEKSDASPCTVVLYRSLCEWDRIRPQYVAEKSEEGARAAVTVQGQGEPATVTV